MNSSYILFSYTYTPFLSSVRCEEMLPRPDHYYRKWLLGIWIGFDPRENEIVHDAGTSQAHYCYALDDNYRVWVHRAESPRCWFGAKRTTRNSLLDHDESAKWTHNYCTDGRRLLHLLIVGSEDEFQDFMRDGVNREDLTSLEWYIFPDEHLPEVSTDANGTTENYHIYDSLLDQMGHYKHDGQACLPYSDPSLTPDLTEHVEPDGSKTDGSVSGEHDRSEKLKSLDSIAQSLCDS